MRLEGYLSRKEAADFLGTNVFTLKGWEKKGKIVSYRNPINGFRLYKKDELISFLENIRCELQTTKE
jgi:DNA-binding transcriptional MerR regulator